MCEILRHKKRGTGVFVLFFLFFSELSSTSLSLLSTLSPIHIQFFFFLFFFFAISQHFPCPHLTSHRGTIKKKKKKKKAKPTHTLQPLCLAHSFPLSISLSFIQYITKHGSSFATSPTHTSHSTPAELHQKATRPLLARR